MNIKYTMGCLYAAKKKKKIATHCIQLQNKFILLSNKLIYITFTLQMRQNGQPM